LRDIRSPPQLLVGGGTGRRVCERGLGGSRAIHDYPPLRNRISAFMNEDIVEHLEQRLGRLHARQRIGIEDDHEARVFGQGLNYFHPENWYCSPAIIRNALKLTGLYWRARKNAERIQIRHYDIVLPQLPSAFDGFTILQISDLHVDMNEVAMQRLIELLPGLAYDLCVLTGDYRGQSFGPFAATIEGMARMRESLAGPVRGVLGNHDTIRMVPALEEMGIRMLLNEAETLVRGDQRIHLVGIDDAHYYRVDNIEKAVAQLPGGELSILLSHTPEIYRQAAHADFDLLLSGHTHGGQICLPGAIPITLDAKLPRRMGSGLWKYRDMVGYTSVGVGSCIVPVRINCPPEIALHHLRYGAGNTGDHADKARRESEKTPQLR
jgi:predicted MPP superfamily phosphohydrolase